MVYELQGHAKHSLKNLIYYQFHVYLYFLDVSLQVSRILKLIYYTA